MENRSETDREREEETNKRDGKGRNEDCGVNEMRLWWFLDKRGAAPLQIRPAPAVARTVGRGEREHSVAQHQHQHQHQYSEEVGSVGR